MSPCRRSGPSRRRRRSPRCWNGAPMCCRRARANSASRSGPARARSSPSGTGSMRWAWRGRRNWHARGSPATGRCRSGTWRCSRMPIWRKARPRSCSTRGCRISGAGTAAAIAVDGGEAAAVAIASVQPDRLILAEPLVLQLPAGGGGAADHGRADPRRRADLGRRDRAPQAGRWHGHGQLPAARCAGPRGTGAADLSRPPGPDRPEPCAPSAHRQPAPCGRIRRQRLRPGGGRAGARRVRAGRDDHAEGARPGARTPCAAGSGRFAGGRPASGCRPGAASCSCARP
jgi:hypothetical protein